MRNRQQETFQNTHLKPHFSPFFFSPYFSTTKQTSSIQVWQEMCNLYTPSTPWSESHPHPVSPATRFSSTHACLSPSSITTRKPKTSNSSRNKQKPNREMIDSKIYAQRMKTTKQGGKDSNLGQELGLTRDVLGGRRAGRAVVLVSGARIF